VVFGCGNEAQRTKSFEMSKRKGMTMEKFIRCFVLKNEGRHAVNEISGSKYAITPKFERSLRREK